MAGEERAVGPFPEGVDHDEYDRHRRRIFWAMPSGLYVLGAVASGRRNLMTLNWASQVATNPKLLAVSVENGAVTRGLVHEAGVFALNIVARTDRAIVRKFVKPLDDDGDPGTLAGFAVTTGVTGCPILEQAVAWLDCEVRHEVDLGSHTLFVGEVVGCGGLDDPDALVLRMEDTRMSYGG